MKKRYYVIAVRGFNIAPGSFMTAQKAHTTYAVLDSANCSREVEVFTPRSYKGGDEKRQAAAEELAKKLNRENYQYEVRQLKEELADLKSKEPPEGAALA